MAQRFSEIAASGKSIDLEHWLQCYAFDVIGEITFGKRFGFLDLGLDQTGVFAAIDAGELALFKYMEASTDDLSANTYSTLVGVFPSTYVLYTESMVMSNFDWQKMERFTCLLYFSLL